jgi:hypothetical protein
MTSAQARLLRNAGKCRGILGPSPAYQGDLIAITHAEWEEIKHLMYPYPLPEILDGEFTYEDDTGHHVINSKEISYLVSHRWYLKTLKWVQEAFGPFDNTGLDGTIKVC